MKTSYSVFEWSADIPFTLGNDAPLILKIAEEFVGRKLLCGKSGIHEYVRILKFERLGFETFIAILQISLLKDGEVEDWSIMTVLCNYDPGVVLASFYHSVDKEFFDKKKQSNNWQKSVFSYRYSIVKDGTTIELRIRCGLNRNIHLLDYQEVHPDIIGIWEFSSICYLPLFEKIEPLSLVDKK